MRLRTGGGLNSVDLVKARQVGRCKFALEAGTGSVTFVTPVVGLIWVSTALFLLSCAETCIVRELFIDRLLACQATFYPQIPRVIDRRGTAL